MILISIYLAIVTFFAYTKAQSPPSSSPQRALGCGKSHVWLGVSELRKLKSSNSDRSFWVHIPGNYNSERSYPVVFGFHGSSRFGLSLDGKFFELDTKLSDSKWSSDKILVYPNGQGGVWAGPSYGKVSVAEDLQYVNDVLDHLKDNYCIDESRIYATGMSNGGGFLGTLACSAVGGRFAAFAPASGSFYTDMNGPDNGCKPAYSPLPMLEFHGGADKDVKYAGGQGEGGLEPSIPDWLAYWATRNNCTSKKQEDSFGNKVHHLSWTCAGVEGALQHWKVDDMGHAWPSTEPNFSQLSALQGPTYIQANDIIMKFFDRFTLPPKPGQALQVVFS